MFIVAQSQWLFFGLVRIGLGILMGLFGHSFWVVAIYYMLRGKIDKCRIAALISMMIPVVGYVLLFRLIGDWNSSFWLTAITYGSFFIGEAILLLSFPLVANLFWNDSSPEHQADQNELKI